MSDRKVTETDRDPFALGGYADGDARELDDPQPYERKFIEGIRRFFPGYRYEFSYFAKKRLGEDSGGHDRDFVPLRPRGAVASPIRSGSPLGDGRGSFFAPALSEIAARSCSGRRALTPQRVHRRRPQYAG